MSQQNLDRNRRPQAPGAVGSHPAPVGISIACECGATLDTKPTADGKPRLFRGWKAMAGVPTCPQCMKERFAPRVVSAEVDTCLNMEWSAFRKAVSGAMGEAARVANIAMYELARLDQMSRRDDGKLTALPGSLRSEHYRAVTARCDGFPTATSCCIMQRVWKKYADERWSIIERGAKSLPSFRYPHPWPVRKQGFILGESDGQPSIAFRIGNSRASISLRGQGVRHFLAAARGEIEYGEMMLVARPAGSNTGRTVETRGNSGSQRRPSKLLVRLVVYLPRRKRDGLEGTLSVRSTRSALLSATLDGDTRPWSLHCAQARRWTAEHSRRMQAMSDDRKHEKRWPRRQRIGMNDASRKWSEKQRNRLDTLIHQMSHSLVQYAARRRAAAIVLDLSNKAYCPQFPWADLKGKIEYKASEMGIDVIEVSASEEAESDA